MVFLVLDVRDGDFLVEFRTSRTDLALALIPALSSALRMSSTLYHFLSVIRAISVKCQASFSPESIPILYTILLLPPESLLHGVMTIQSMQGIINESESVLKKKKGKMCFVAPPARSRHLQNIFGQGEAPTPQSVKPQTDTRIRPERRP